MHGNIAGTQATARLGRRSGALRTGVRAEDKRPGPVTIIAGPLPAPEARRNEPARPLMVFGLPMVALNAPTAWEGEEGDRWSDWESDPYYSARRAPAGGAE